MPLCLALDSILGSWSNRWKSHGKSASATPKFSESYFRHADPEEENETEDAVDRTVDLFGDPLDTDLFGDLCVHPSPEGAMNPMAKMLNPITYAESVVEDFLRYQLTTYSFADPSLHAQMRQLLNLDQTRRTPLLAGPFVSLSRSFRRGPSMREMAERGLLHRLLANIADHEHLYGHQETAIRSIVAGQTTLISTGTGSGKTECFLYPIISKALELRDAGEPEGICAVIIYPMNALAEDQLGRLRELLCGVGISFGLYVG